MKHVLSCEQFSKNEINALFKKADDIRTRPKDYAQSLNGKVVATLFYEPSTRTRLSFESAILRLGGANISTENASEMSSAIKGESLTDTIRVVQGYADCIIMRHFEEDSAERAAAAAQVPIINAGAGAGEHPTQALLDAYTIYREKGGIIGSIAILGDLLYGRTIHSLIKLLALYDGITVYGLSIKPLALPQEYIDFMQSRNIDYRPVASLNELPSGLDVIYQTRTQTERFKEKGIKAEEIVLDKQSMAHFSDSTIVLHPLPRNNEISPDLDDDPRAVYFKQSTNGMYIRMALLHELVL